MPTESLGKVLDELHIKISAEHSKGRLVWEEKLRLHLRPKPKWCPDGLWAKIVGLVVVQSIERTI